MQTVRHRDYFLPVGGESDAAHAVLPSAAVAWMSLVLLVRFSDRRRRPRQGAGAGIERAVEAAAVPHAVVGIAIALMVLLPETWAAVRAAMRNRMQTSFNLALGSALATIGLTIPAGCRHVPRTGVVAGPRPAGQRDRAAGADLLISTMTLSRGHATVLQGAVHLVVFAVFLFLAVAP